MPCKEWTVKEKVETVFNTVVTKLNLIKKKHHSTGATDIFWFLKNSILKE